MKFQRNCATNWLYFAKKRALFNLYDASTIYEVPNLMLEEGLDVVALKKIRFTKKQLRFKIGIFS
jgi:CTP synthase (UTP-ammonia lyase)